MYFEDKIVEILQGEFQPQKKRTCFIRKAKPATPQPIGFSEFQLWLYRNNCQELLEDSEFMQSMLVLNGSSFQEKSSDCLNLYAKSIVEQEKKHQTTSQKLSKISSLLSNTQIFSNNMNVASVVHDEEEAESVQFDIYIDSVTGLGRSQNKYHLELGYKDESAFSNNKRAENGMINFEGEHMSYGFSNKEGSVFLHLCEVFVQDGKTYKKVVARGSLDLFSHAKLASNKKELLQLQENGEYDTILLKRSDEEAGIKALTNFEDSIVEVKILVIPQNDSTEKDLESYYFNIMKWREEYLGQVLNALKRKAQQIEDRLNLMLAPFHGKLFFYGGHLISESNNETQDTTMML